MRTVETDRVYRYWNPPKVLDQGPTPRCVAFSACGWLLGGPVRNVDPFTDWGKIDAYAQKLYQECQENDEWPGTEYDGTSVRAAFKVLKARGFVLDYRWAWEAETVAQHVLGIGPVVVGTDWYGGMSTPDDESFIHPEGGLLGGHAWLLTGFSRVKRCPDGSRGAFRLQNSWGPGWGQKGRAWISFADMDRLIRAEGEAATASELDLDAVRKALGV